MSHSGILLVFVGMCSVLCFANQNFEVILERVELSYDPKVIKIDYEVTKYNRTCKAFSANITIPYNVEYSDNLRMQVQLFALYSNEYRRVPVSFTRNICDTFNMEFLWIKNELQKNGHVPTSCPIRADTYYVKDFVPNGANIPAVANFPWKSIICHLRFMYNDTVGITIYIYMTLDHDVELKRLG